MRPKARRMLNLVLALIVLVGMAAVYSGRGLSWRDLAALKAAPRTGAGATAVQEGAAGCSVSAAHPLAVEAGMAVLARGGNAVDAAVAVSYALAVVEPYASGLGGGGAALVHPAGESAPVAYDYRETFPLSGETPRGHAGVPGFVLGMAEMHKAFGRLDFRAVIEPALRLAEEGFTVNESLHNRLVNNRYRLPVAALPHFYPGGIPVEPGGRIKQEELAATLRLIRDRGAEAFYTGPVAAHISAAVPELTAVDFREYSVRQAAPVSARVGGFEVFAAPPPLGGVTLLQILQMAEILQAERFALASDTAASVDLLAVLLKRAYYERAAKIADPAYIYVPAAELAGGDYARRMAGEVAADRFGGLLDDYVIEDTPADFEDHDNTTHLVVVDGDGMMVSATNTISQFFGSGIYVDGFFLNNQLKNFNTDPGSINYPEPGKRPRSYITPTILARAGRPVLGIGTPGGKKIPMVLTQVLLRFILGGDSLEAAVAAPRFFIEDRRNVYLEKDIPAAEKEELRRLGYTVLLYDVPITYGAVYAIHPDYENDRIYAVADPRRSGAARVAR